jgi:acyl-CoA dehydrogenase
VRELHDLPRCALQLAGEHDRRGDGLQVRRTAENVRLALRHDEDLARLDAKRRSRIVGQPRPAGAAGDEMERHDALGAREEALAQFGVRATEDAPRRGELAVEVDRAIEAHDAENVGQCVHSRSAAIQASRARSVDARAFRSFARVPILAPTPTSEQTARHCDKEQTMTAAAERFAAEPSFSDWQELARTLGRRFGERAAAHDADDRFVAENYVDLARYGFFAAGVPIDLGGGGVNHAELGALLRELGRHCGSTALAFSMHTHLVATAAWRWQHQKAPVDGLLRRVASEQIVLLSSGGSDWLNGSGTATKVEGGFRIDARKVFASGAPAAKLFMTTAVYDDPAAGPTVLHIAVPMSAPGVRVVPTWRTLGMRGTGSHDVVLENVFVPDAGVSVRRPRGRWHPAIHVVAMIAIPLIYSVYVGVAESARDLAIERARKRPLDAHLVDLAGAIDNALATARLALGDMYAAAAGNAPGAATTQRIMCGRALVADAVLEVVDVALELGGGAFFRDAGIERRFRDAQACRYHPLQERVQREYAGRLALDLDLDAPPGHAAAA